MAVVRPSSSHKSTPLTHHDLGLLTLFINFFLSMGVWARTPSRQMTDIIHIVYNELITNFCDYNQILKVNVYVVVALTFGKLNISMTRT